MLLLRKFNDAFFFTFISLLSLFSLFPPLFADVDSRITPPPDASLMTTSFSPPSPPPFPDFLSSSSPFKPSIAVIVGVLTTMFSITLLLLLYAKHCKRGEVVVYNGFHVNSITRRTGYAPSTARKNSGIDRAVIESLPIFRFSSLRGQKDGLECAVCLTRFEPPEVLRLLPKCKHAFHVECVDTWLDAHCTCPLCRYRVDPEDILLIDHASSNILHGNHLPPPPEDPESLGAERGTADTDRAETHSEKCRRISGRHSSAGEKASGFIPQVVVQRPTAGSERIPSGSRNHSSNGPTWFARRSLDIGSLRKKSNKESVAVGCFDRYQSHQRKDGLLLTNDDDDGDSDGDGDGDGDDRESKKTGGGAGGDMTRLEHRIIVSGSGFHQRWSDVQPSDLLYLRSEMIISDSRRLSTALGSRPSVGRRQQQQNTEGNMRTGGESIDEESGRSVINSRSVSEITGLSRFSSRGSNNSRHHRERQAGVVSRWLAWISSQSHIDVRSNRTPTDDAA